MQCYLQGKGTDLLTSEQAGRTPLQFPRSIQQGCDLSLGVICETNLSTPKLQHCWGDYKECMQIIGGLTLNRYSINVYCCAQLNTYTPKTVPHCAQTNV